MATEKIVLGGGCFWCLEAVFRDLKGVTGVVSGYAGGTVPSPTYEAVCSGTTGHAEVVEVSFDPAIITLEQILEIFFTLHDPTTRDRQGNDVGTQYRSIILTASDAQRPVAEAVRSRFERDRIWPDPIVTTIEPLTQFHPAETYHQEYYARNGGQPYCQVIIAPKVAKLRKEFRDRLR